ncbi:hypothetical protein [Natronolimnohabitans innermongolicus]|uniref:Uncharacterized protein n=1 Tax=Natronolimnohabitans innermongolicus JCM 12255 TaxID=1227499 RepID=L9XJY3_9EURY|nr:hypothetical protein [Natronolimnohabitans innermongolicus]ELY62074.1 hypothetical protein C493_01050 [Natronolimnohabitans innermongolicus JCM 12255]
MDEIDHQFQAWLTCPDCTGDSGVGILAHGTEIVIECYDCGTSSEFTIGQDVPVSNLDTSEIERFAQCE